MEEDAGTLGAQRLSREESQDEGEGGSTKTNNVWQSLTEALNEKANSKIKLKRKEFAQWYPVWMDNVAPRRYGLLKEKSSENAHWDRIPPQTLSLWLHLALGIENHSNMEDPHSSPIWVEKEPPFAWLHLGLSLHPAVRDIWLPLWFCLFKQYVYFILWAYGFCLHISLCTTCLQVPSEARRGHCIPWNWSYRQLERAMWVVGFKPRDSERATGALNRAAIYPALDFAVSFSLRTRHRLDVKDLCLQHTEVVKHQPA